MRVRDDHSLDAAQRVHALGRLVVEVRDAVPEDVAARGANEDGALADGELRRRHDGSEPGVGVVLAGEGAEVIPAVPSRAQGREGGEALAGWGGVLAGVIADEAGREGGAVGGGVLGAACVADEVGRGVGHVQRRGGKLLGEGLILFLGFELTFTRNS